VAAERKRGRGLELLLDQPVVSFPEADHPVAGRLEPAAHRGVAVAAGLGRHRASDRRARRLKERGVKHEEREQRTAGGDEPLPHRPLAACPTALPSSSSSTARARASTTAASAASGRHPAKTTRSAASATRPKSSRRESPSAPTAAASSRGVMLSRTAS